MKLQTVFIAGLVATCLAGCGSGRSSSGDSYAPSPRGAAHEPKRSARVLTLLAIDYSKSTAPIRAQILAASNELATGFDPAESSLRVYRFGNDVQEIYSGVPNDEDAFASLLAEKVKGSDPVRGTQYPKMLVRIAEVAETATEGEVRVVVAGDGFNDFAGDPSFERMYREAARRLASNAKVSYVRYWGVGVGAREGVRSMFRGCETKLQILSLDQDLLPD